MKSLTEVKKPNTSAKLATKHASLTNVISSIGNNLSFKQETWVLGVHCRNVSLALQCRRMMNFRRIYFWT